MVRFTGGLLLFSVLSAAAPADVNHDQLQASSQQVIQSSGPSSSVTPRKLKGRFLHITDVHPDPYYQVHTSADGEHPCHQGGENGTAGYYGAEATDCDTPFSLVNATFFWIKENLKDEIDFVVWTGDSARHDNDDQYPRIDKQVVDLNKYVVSKFVEVFGKTDNIDDPDPTNDFVVPIVPTFGNNDILPHNIFEPGPNLWTRRYEDIWRQFVPQEQKHSFARGGWFFSEVIPNKLAVFSLNTLYFFDSNSAVDGCDAASEPGYEHMDWLRIQLQFLRQRGMKAILIGHVPPARTESKQNWDETCYQKFTLWLRLYRDVIVSSIWGHMNIDHFMFQDVKELKYDFKIKDIDDDFKRKSVYTSHHNDERFTVQAKAAYLNELRDGWADLPTPPRGFVYADAERANESEDEEVQGGKKKKKKGGDKKGRKMDKFLRDIGGPWAERFSLSLVSPSVVPNYFPTLRVVEYNITGMEEDHPAMRATGIPADHKDIDAQSDSEGDHEEEFEEAIDNDSIHNLKKKKGKKGRKSKPKKPNFPMPRPPSTTAVPGPAYSPQPLSLLSWSQYFANLTTINAEAEASGFEEAAKHHHAHVKYHVEYHTNTDHVYKMKDLTVRSFLDLAERIGRASIRQPSDLARLEGEDVPKMELKRKNEGTETVVENDNEEDDNKNKKKIKNHVWRTFIKRAFVHTKLDEDLDDQFGS